MRNSDVTEDVLIAGCGPVGGVLAALLGRYGIRTLVVDPDGAPYPLPRAAVLDAGVVRILAALPGLTPVTRWTVPLRHGAIMDAGHRELIGATVGDDAASGLPEVNLIHQPTLEAGLRAGLAGLSTVRRLAGHSVVGVEPGDDHVTVTVAEGPPTAGAATTGATRRVRARWVVGCDGAGSRVRHLLGQAYEGRTFAQPWLVVDGETTGAAPDGDAAGRDGWFAYVLDPARPAVAMGHGRRRRWEWMLLPGEDPARMTGPETVRRLVRPWTDPETLRVERAATFTFHARAAARWRQGRVLLAGDAAHLMPPFAGQGLSSGIRDASALAWRLAEVVRGVADESTLDDYERERRPEVLDTTRLALRIGRLLQTRNRVGSALLRTVIRAVGSVPALVRRAEQTRPGPVRGLPRGAAPAHPGAGRILPDPRVRADALAEVRLDDLLGHRWALIGVGVDPRDTLDAAGLAWAEAREAVPLLLAVPGAPGPDHLAPGCAVLTDLDGALLPALATGKTAGPVVAVVRPDRVLHGCFTVPLNSAVLPGSPADPPA